MSLQLRYVYARDGQIEGGEYYYPKPDMAGWTLAVQARETDWCPPPKPKRTDSNRKWRTREKRRARAQAQDACRV